MILDSFQRMMPPYARNNGILRKICHIFRLHIAVQDIY